MLVAAVIDVAHREVADAIVEQPRLHRLLRQQHHAVVHQHAMRAGAERRCAAAAAGSRRRGTTAAAGRCRLRRIVVGVGRFDLDVLGERHRALDERPRRVERPRADARPSAELRHVGREEPRHLDHRGVVLAQRLDVERHQDRTVVGGIDRPGDRRRRVSDDVVGDGPEQDPVAAALPPDDAVAGRLSAVPRAERRPRNLADPEELAAEAVFGNLVVDAILDAVHREDAVIGLRVLRDDAIVRTDFGFRRPSSPSAPGLRWILRRGILGKRVCRRQRCRQGQRQVSNSHIHPSSMRTITARW